MYSQGGTGTIPVTVCPLFEVRDQVFLIFPSSAQGTGHRAGAVLLLLELKSWYSWLWEHALA